MYVESNRRLPQTAPAAGGQPIPPYGHALIAAREAGWSGTLFLVCGAHAWEDAKRRIELHPTVLLPPGKDPRGYRWPVSGLDILVFVKGAISPETLAALVEDLLAARARSILVFDPLEHLGAGLKSFGTVSSAYGAEDVR